MRTLFGPRAVTRMFGNTHGAGDLRGLVTGAVCDGNAGGTAARERTRQHPIVSMTSGMTYRFIVASLGLSSRHGLRGCERFAPARHEQLLKLPFDRERVLLRAGHVGMAHRCERALHAVVRRIIRGNVLARCLAL